MIKIEDTETYGWEAAIRGMRNPLNSWDKSDTKLIECTYIDCEPRECEKTCVPVVGDCGLIIGDEDLKLMKKLVKSGNDHSKFMRFITVTCDITAPFYFWKEFDTYKVGTVANSCSTMHKLTSKEITEEDFSIEDGMLHCFVDTIVECERLRKEYLATGDKTVWKALIELLPNGYMQKRTVMLNYAALRNMYFARRNHKLDEWHDFCKWIESLPYSELITMEE